MCAFKWNWKSLLSQGTCSDREDVQTPMSQLLVHGFWQRTCARDTAKLQSCAWLRSPQHLLLELEVSMSGCQAHTIALCLIWIYQSTELNAAREKDFGSEEVFSSLGQINKWPLPLFSVSKLWGKKCLKYLHKAQAIEAPLLAASLQMVIC